jgi:hypothetical protein
MIDRAPATTIMLAQQKRGFCSALAAARSRGGGARPWADVSHCMIDRAPATTIMLAEQKAWFLFCSRHRAESRRRGPSMGPDEDGPHPPIHWRLLPDPVAEVSPRMRNANRTLILPKSVRAESVEAFFVSKSPSTSSG